MKKSRVLLVEDDEAMCEELIPILETNNYLPDVARDGKSAIALLEKDSYELMLLDLKIPSISGYEVLKCAKKMYPRVKIIVLSGSGLRQETKKEEDQIFPDGVRYEKLISQSADAFLTKPFSVEVLLTCMKQLYSMK